MKYLPLLIFTLSCSNNKTELKEFLSPPIEITPEYVCNYPVRDKEPDYSNYKYVLGESETFFEFKEEINRAANIELAINKIKGEHHFLILQPDDTFSYNRLVGIRSKENGFLNAPTIFDGEMRDDVGGGICQVSSTIFSAAVFAGLKIVERSAHSRPSTYIGKGLDAMVAYPESCSQKYQPCFDFDLKIKNEYNFPVMFKIDSYIKNVSGKQKKTITVEFLAEQPGRNIKTRWITLETEPYTKETRLVNYGSSRWKRIKQKGQRGYKGYLEITEALHEDEEKKFFIRSLL